MKTPEEKIQFKNHFFKLGQGRIIPVSDDKYWLVFWNVPRELTDIFDLLTPYDIQTVRDQNLPNVLLFVYVLALKTLHFATNFSSRKHLELLNCLRLLSKVIPFIYELPNYSSEIEPALFWSRKFTPLNFLLASPGITLDSSATVVISDEEPVLAASLATALVELLLKPGFTVDEQDGKLANGMLSNGTASSKLILWEPGIGGSGKYRPPNSIHDSNRVEVLRTLLVLISSSFYEKPSTVISQGSRFLTFMVACLPRSNLVSMVCSLFNITCRSARKTDECGLVFDNTALSELRYLCVSYSVQLLTAMLVHPIPSLETTQLLLDNQLTTSKKPLNVVRLFFGNLSRDSELLFMVSHLLNILKFPFQSQEDRTKSQPSPWALEATIILWELLQCNKNFRNTIAHRLVVSLAPYLLYHVFAFHNNPQYSNIVKISAYFLFYISTEELWVETLVLPMSNSVIDAFPSDFQSLHVTSTRDFLIVHICDILRGVSPTGHIKLPAHLLSFLMPTLVEILYNITPVINKNIEGTSIASKRMANINAYGGLSYLACSALTQLLVKFSTKTFLLEEPRNAEMLALILRALCTTAIKQPTASRMLLFTFMKNEKIYDGIWSVIYGLGNEYFYSENMKLMNVQEDEEESNDSETALTSPVYGSFTSRPVTSPDQHSINSVTTNEDYFPGFKDSLNNSLTNSLISILPEETEETDEDDESALRDALRPPLPTGMSLKAKEKLPQDSSLSQTWGGNDALRIIITIIIPHIKLELEDLLSKEDDSFDNFYVVTQIERSNLKAVIEQNRVQINYDFLPDTPVDTLPFNWSSLSLGWYVSTFYFDIYNSTETVRKFVKTSKTLMNNISSSIAVLSKFASNWSGLGTPAPNSHQDQITIDYVERGSCWLNLWESSNVRLFKIKANDNDKFFNAFGLKFGNATPNIGGANDITHSLARRFSDFRSRSIVSSTTSIPQTIDELPDGPRLSKRNSVSSLHSLNTLNRSRSNTPRNSFST